MLQSQDDVAPSAFLAYHILHMHPYSSRLYSMLDLSLSNGKMVCKEWERCQILRLCNQLLSSCLLPTRQLTGSWGSFFHPNWLVSLCFSRDLHHSRLVSGGQSLDRLLLTESIIVFADLHRTSVPAAVVRVQLFLQLSGLVAKTHWLNYCAQTRLED